MRVKILKPISNTIGGYFKPGETIDFVGAINRSHDDKKKIGIEAEVLQSLGYIEIIQEEKMSKIESKKPAITDVKIRTPMKRRKKKRSK